MARFIELPDNYDEVNYEDLSDILMDIEPSLHMDGVKSSRGRALSEECYCIECEL